MLTMLLRGKKLTQVSLGSVLMTAVLTAAVLTAAPAAPAAAGDFPTWEEVEQAKENAADKAGQVSEIEQLLGELTADAGSLGTAAVQASGEYQRAAAEAEENNRALDVLSRQRQEAAESAQLLSEQMGALAAQTYKTGGMDSSLLMLLDADEAVGAMERLTTLQGLTDRTGSLHAQSTAAANVLHSLEEKESAAVRIREESAAEAQRLASDAEAAAAVADAAVREQQERSALMLEQLADLRGTSVQVETERIRGLQAEETYRQQQAARQAEETAGETGSVTVNRGSGQLAPPAAEGRDPVIIPIPAPQVPKPKPVAPAPPVSPAPVVPEPAPAPAPTPAPVPVPVDDPAGAQAYASSRLGAYGWGQDQFRCLVNLWQRESGWRTSANNPYSGAYGIPQSYPGDKMASVGADWRTNYRTQIEWGLGYIQWRYANPCAAWQHSEDKNWY